MSPLAEMQKQQGGRRRAAVSRRRRGGADGPYPPEFTEQDKEAAATLQEMQSQQPQTQSTGSVQGSVNSGDRISGAVSGVGSVPSPSVGQSAADSGKFPWDLPQGSSSGPSLPPALQDTAQSSAAAGGTKKRAPTRRRKMAGGDDAAAAPGPATLAAWKIRQALGRTKMPLVGGGWFGNLFGSSKPDTTPDLKAINLSLIAEVYLQLLAKTAGETGPKLENYMNSLTEAERVNIRELIRQYTKGEAPPMLPPGTYVPETPAAAVPALAPAAVPAPAPAPAVQVSDAADLQPAAPAQQQGGRRIRKKQSKARA